MLCVSGPGFCGLRPELSGMFGVLGELRGAYCHTDTDSTTNENTNADVSTWGLQSLS